MALRLQTSLLLVALATVLLAGCSTRPSDELALLREFTMPWCARVLRYDASPEEPG